MCLVFVSAVVIAAAMLSDISAVSAQTTENALREEYEQKKVLINDMFQTKVQKIRQRTVLPEDIMNVLIKQADEVREFDIYTLDRKLELKLRHAKERDEVREKLRKEAQERVKWLLENEEAFKATQDERAQEDAKKLDRIENVPAQIAPEQKPAEPNNK